VRVLDGGSSLPSLIEKCLPSAAAVVTWRGRFRFNCIRVIHHVQQDRLPPCASGRHCRSSGISGDHLRLLIAAPDIDAASPKRGAEAENAPDERRQTIVPLAGAPPGSLSGQSEPGHPNRLCKHRPRKERPGGPAAFPRSPPTSTTRASRRGRFHAQPRLPACSIVVDLVSAGPCSERITEFHFGCGARDAAQNKALSARARTRHTRLGARYSLHRMPRWANSMTGFVVPFT
jgi:hypothetical protein